MAGYRSGLRLPGSVVVVAGAAGGIGGAVAAALAGAGASPVLLDRSSAELDRVAGLCGDRALPALALPVDLADAGAVRDAAQAVVDRHGRLDGWIQCASATAPGGLLDLSLDEVRRVLDADVLGALHGARAALPHMIAQQRGVLVVVVAVHAQLARPFAAPQGMAGAAVRVLAGALRQELRLDGARGVAVTTVLALPAAIDHVDGAGPGRVAATVLRQLRHPRLEKVAGGPLTTALVHGHALVPAVTEWLVAQRSRRAGS